MSRVVRRTIGSVPGDSPYDSVYGHRTEGAIKPDSAPLDDTRSLTYAENCRFLGSLASPPVEPVDYDPLFDGPNPERFTHQSTNIEGETS